jgi:FkbM family methyltransferase
LKSVSNYIDFKYRHGFIQWLINADIKGVRKLAHHMPYWLISKPAKPLHLRLKNDLLVLIDPVKDNGVEHSLYYTGTYEMGTLNLLKEFLQDGDTFVDVGANIGLMSLFAAQCVGEHGKVIAFEPHEETRSIAYHNLEINGLESIIQLRSVGIGARSENKILYDNWSVNRGAASLINRDKEVGKAIDIVALDEVIGEDNVKLIKIDVEGYELEALKGALRILRRTKPPIIIVECTEETESQEYTRAKLYDFIKVTQPKYGFYRLKGTKLRRSKLIKVNGIDDLPTHDNLICIPQS